MKLGRACVVVGVAAALAQLAPPPADAKSFPELVLSGGDLPHEIRLAPETWTSIIRNTGTVWEEASAPARLTGTSYWLDLYNTTATPPEHEARWAYYPSLGGASFTDGGTLRWMRFGGALSDFLNEAIAVGGLPPVRHGRSWVPIVLVLFLLAGVASWGLTWRVGRRMHASSG